jgi:hypothetical protein
MAGNHVKKLKTEMLKLTKPPATYLTGDIKQYVKMQTEMTQDSITENVFSKIEMEKKLAAAQNKLEQEMARMEERME